jgi:hypothetical protein
VASFFGFSSSLEETLFDIKRMRRTVDKNVWIRKAE